VNVGDEVRAGELIAELDPEDYELQLEEAEASLARARAEARNAEANYERVRALYENHNASRQDLDAARAASESASAQVEADEKKVELARLQVGYTRLLAPMEGAIAAVDIEVNENVATGQTVVLLTGGAEIEVNVAVPEALISGIRERDPVTVTFDALPDREFPALVTEVGVAATGMATTYPVTVCLTGEESEVRPGMAAEVGFRFQGTDERERLLVPTAAIGEDGEGRFAFVVERVDEGLGVAHRREVAVGELTSEGLEILRGLADGDLLVTAGVSRIEDGQTVKLTSAP
jgi:RND family efflux transporter MFP subunit